MEGVSSPESPVAPSRPGQLPSGPFQLKALRAARWLGLDQNRLRLTAGNAAVWISEPAPAGARGFRLRVLGDPARYLRLVPPGIVERAADATLLEVRGTDNPKEAYFVLATDPHSFMGASSSEVEVRPGSKNGRRWLIEAVTGVPSASSAGGVYKCPYSGCSVSNLAEDDLCHHCETVHARNNTDEICPICVARGGVSTPQGRSPWGFSSHLHSAHGPRAAHNAIPAGVMTYGFSLVVCRHPDGRFLLVEESCSQGWWLPGGRVDPGEGFEQAAIRETDEEAGVDVELTGILAFQYSPHGSPTERYYARQRMIFLARPKHPERPPKSQPDFESVGAVWISWPDMEKKVKAGTLELRGHEPMKWFKHVHDGGAIYPMKVMGHEA